MVGGGKSLGNLYLSDECECSVDVRQTARQFYTAYKLWRQEQGFGFHARTQSGVTRDLQALGHRVAKSNGERWVHGIKAPTGTIGTFPAEPISMMKNIKQVI